MFIEVSKKSLTSALQHLTPIVSTRSVIPILSGIKLQVDESGLTITSANTGIMLQYRIPSDRDDLHVHNYGSVVIPARYFTDIIRCLPSGFVKIGGDQNIRIQSGNVSYNLIGMNSDEYPGIVKQDECHRISLSNPHLKQLIRSVTFAVSSSEARPVLTGVSFEISHERLRLVASDGIRLSAQTTHQFTSEQPDPSIAIIIPGKHLLHYSKMIIDQQSTTEMAIGNHTITLNTPNITMQSSLIEGTYPSIERITPEAFTSEFTADSDALLCALERVTLLSGEGSIVKLRKLKEGSIELSSKTAEIGDVVEEIQSEKQLGNEINIAFNGKYMIDILRAIDFPTVTLKFTDKWKPVVVQPTDHPSSLFLITPIRTPDH